MMTSIPNLEKRRDPTHTRGVFHTAGRQKVQRAVETLRQGSCEKFQVDGLQGEDKVFRVWFEHRVQEDGPFRAILNVRELVDKCKAWVPHGYTKTECVKKPIEDTLKVACELQNFDAVVVASRAGTANGLFVKPNGGAVVEVLADKAEPVKHQKHSSPNLKERAFFRDMFNSTKIPYFNYVMATNYEKAMKKNEFFDESSTWNFNVDWNGGMRNILEAIAELGGNMQIYDHLQLEMGINQKYATRENIRNLKQKYI